MLVEYANKGLIQIKKKVRDVRQSPDSGVGNQRELFMLKSVCVNCRIWGPECEVNLPAEPSTIAR